MDPFFLSFLLLLGAFFCAMWWAYLAGRRAYAQYSSYSALQWLDSSFPMLFVILCFVYLGHIIVTPYWDFNAARVAPSVAIAKGYDLYYGPYDGPVLGTMYGPVKALLYLPAALASNSTMAVMVAATLNVMLMLIPLYWLAFKFKGNKQQKVLGYSVSVFMMSAVLFFDSTALMVTRVHVDAPAVGLGLLSCLLLMREPHQLTHKFLFMAATVAILAVWSKQLEVFLLFGQLLYLGLAFGFRMMWRYGLWLLLCGSVISLLFMSLLGGIDNTLFNILTIPSQQNLNVNMMGIVWAIWDVIWQSIILIIIVSAGVIITLQEANIKGKIAWRQWLQHNNWLLLLLVSMAMLPISVVAAQKVLAEANSHHFMYYLIACSGIVLLNLAAKLNQFGCYAKNVLLVMSVVMTGVAMKDLDHLRGLAELEANPQWQADQLAKQYSEQIYFPHNPLVTLINNSKLYHFSDGVYNRHLSGYGPTYQHYIRYLPKDLRYIAYKQNAGFPNLGVAAQYLPEFNQKIKYSEPFLYWIFYMRKIDH